MKLTLDEMNHIIGVDEENTNYVYQGAVPADFEQHKTDGYYMIANQMIVQTPVSGSGVTKIEMSNVSQQLANLAIIAAMNNAKGNGE